VRRDESSERAFVAQLTDNPPVPRLSRRSSAVLFALALVCALLLGAGVAVAAGSGSQGSSGSAAAGSGGAGSGSPLGGGPLSPGVTAPPTPTTATQAATATTSATNTAASGGGSIGNSSIIGIVVGAVIVIGGVCFFIFRDAGRRAPSRGRRADAGPSPERNVPGSQRVKPRKLSAQERRRRKRGRAPRRK
jgi:predicted PurR-regulated permease PerM